MYSLLASLAGVGDWVAAGTPARIRFARLTLWGRPGGDPHLRCLLGSFGLFCLSGFAFYPHSDGIESITSQYLIFYFYLFWYFQKLYFEQ